VVGRLSALPFCAATLPEPGGASPESAGDLLSAVFPHARTERDTAQARYVAIDEDLATAGSFVTLLTAAGTEVACVARFHTDPGGEWLGPSDLGEWDVTRSARLPAAAIFVDVTASTPRGSFSRRLVRSASAALALDSAQEAAP
jgi:hypothetical protein